MKTVLETNSTECKGYPTLDIRSPEGGSLSFHCEKITLTCGAIKLKMETFANFDEFDEIIFDFGDKKYKFVKAKRGKKGDRSGK